MSEKKSCQILYTNIQSLLANINELRIYVNEHKPQLILLSESRQTNSILDSEIEINDYNIVRCDSENRRTGGCVIYLKKCIEYQIIKNVKIEKFWLLIIEIKKGFKKGLYGVLYKSPKQKKRQFLKIIDENFEEVIKSDNFNFITGDFNIDLNIKNIYTENLVNIFTQYNLTQIIMVTLAKQIKAQL